MEITRERLDRLADSASQHASDADVQQDQPIWDRPLVEAEWRSLLANPVFMAELMAGIGSMLETTPAPGEFLLIKNWPKSAHEELLPMLPEHLAGSFDLSAFRQDGSWPYLDQTEGLRILSAGVVTGPAGCDESRFTPHGDHLPLGPYADIAALQRVPLPIRLDRTRGRVRVVPDDGGLLLMVEQFRCGQAIHLGNGYFRVEEEIDGGKSTAILANEATQEAAADLLLAAGQRQVLELGR